MHSALPRFDLVLNLCDIRQTFEGVAMKRFPLPSIRLLIPLVLLASTVFPAWAFAPAEPPAAPALAEEGSWPMLGANPQRSSWSPVEVRGNLSVEWYRTINARMTHEYEPIAAEDKIFVATTKGLFAFKASDGAHLWTYGTEMPLGSAPTYANGVVYAGGYDRRIHAVDAATGALKSGLDLRGSGCRIRDESRGSQ